MTLVQRLEARSARVCVIGQGYVGLALAVEFARAGFFVTGIDLDADRVAALNAGRAPIPPTSSRHACKHYWRMAGTPPPRT